MHRIASILPAICVLLPAVVGGTPQAAIRAVAGAWAIAVEDGGSVFTHDPSKWAAKEGYPLALFTDPREFSNGTATIEFKLIGGTDDYSAGLVFGHTGGATYHYVRYNTKDGDVAVWRMDGPKRTVLQHGEQHEQLAKNVWHTLELTVDGRKVRASVNGGRIPVEHELDAPASGQLGLWVKPDVKTAFRNLRVVPR